MKFIFLSFLWAIPVFSDVSFEDIENSDSIDSNHYIEKGLPEDPLDDSATLKESSHKKSKENKARKDEDEDKELSKLEKESQKPPVFGDTFKALLKKDSLVRSLKTQELLKVPQELYVHARVINGNNQISIILDKNMNPIYEVRSSNLSNMSSDLRLVPNTDFNIHYKAPSPPSPYFLKEKPTTHFLSFGSGVIKNHYFSKLLSAKKKGTFYNLTYRGYLNSRLPFLFGIESSLQFANANESSKWESFKVGASLRYNINKTLNTHFSLLRSLLFEINHNNKQYDFYSLGYTIGITKKISKMFWWSLNYENSKILPSKDSPDFNQLKSKNVNKNLGFEIGLKFKI